MTLLLCSVDDVNDYQVWDSRRGGGTGELLSHESLGSLHDGPLLQHRRRPCHRLNLSCDGTKPAAWVL